MMKRLVRQEFIMNNQELLSAVSIAGRYEVITRLDGSFMVLPIPHNAVIILIESHKQCIERYRRKRE